MNTTPLTTNINCKYVVLLEYSYDDYKRAEVTSTVKFCNSEDEAKAKILDFISDNEIVWGHIRDHDNITETVDEIIDRIDNYREFVMMNPQIHWTVWTGSEPKVLQTKDRGPPWFRELIEKQLNLIKQKEQKK